MRHFTRSNDTCQRETVYETSLFHIESNLDRLRLCLPIHNQHSQHRSGQNTLQPVSQRHTSILRFMVEALSWCSWRASQHPPVQSLVLPPKRAQTSLFAPCIWSRDKGSDVPPRPAPPISRFRSESGVYSRTPPLMMPSPLKTVWFVDSTGSTPPSTSGIPLTGYSTTGLLTVSSLPREAARAERKVPV